MLLLIWGCPFLQQRRTGLKEGAVQFYVTVLNSSVSLVSKLDEPRTWDDGLAVKGETNVVGDIHVFTALFILQQVDLHYGLWAEVRQQHHTLPLQRAVLAIQLQQEDTES